MEFKIMSREKAKKFSYSNIELSTVIVSITDFGSLPVTFSRNGNIKAVLNLQFNDVDCGEENCMTKEDAVKIISFINTYLQDIEQIIVQCEAGVSRSAGVCAALMLIITGSDNSVFDNPAFVPNRYCYRLILNSYFGSYDTPPIDDKFKCNIEEFKKR